MNIDITKIIIKKYYPLINKILNHDFTHYWITGGRGSTKSSFIGITLILLLILNKDVNILVLRKISGTLKDSVFNQLIWAIDTMGLNDYFKMTLNPLEIIYKPTKQVVFFRGADDPMKIKSIKPKHGYIGAVWLNFWPRKTFLIRWNS